MKKNVFIKNAIILTVTSLLLRTIGIFFRVYMSNKIGAEGMGLYQLIFSIYVLGSTFATTGICTAVTRMVTDELACGKKKSVRKILGESITLSVLLGIVSTALIYFGAELIGQYWIRDMRAVPALKILSFSLPFMGACSCLRGYFIARRRVSTPSRSQILEQFVRIAVIVLLIDQFSKMGLAYACMAVMIGDTLAEIVSCLYMGIGYAIDKRRIQDAPLAKATPYRILNKMLSIAIPITAGRYLHTILRTIENTLVPNSLMQFSGSKERGLSEFGMLKGMAMPIIFFPASFLSAFATLLVPEISEASALGQKAKVERAVTRTLRITFTSSILISGIFTLFSRELGLLIYNSEEVGFLIKVLAPLMPIMYAETVVDGILKGLNQQVSSLKYSVIDSASRIVLIVAIVPYYGMEGFLFIMVLSNLLTCFLSIHRLLVVTNMKMQWGQWIFKPALAIATAGAVALLIQKIPWIQGLSYLPSIIIGGIVAMALYCVLLPPLGCISREDFQIRSVKIKQPR